MNDDGQRTKAPIFRCFFVALKNSLGVNSVDFEKEYVPTEAQEDTIWMLDGRGNFVKVEVEDDACDD